MEYIKKWELTSVYDVRMLLYYLGVVPREDITDFILDARKYGRATWNSEYNWFSTIVILTFKSEADWEVHKTRVSKIVQEDKWGNMINDSLIREIPVRNWGHVQKDIRELDMKLGAAGRVLDLMSDAYNCGMLQGTRQSLGERSENKKLTLRDLGIEFDYDEPVNKPLEYRFDGMLWPDSAKLSKLIIRNAGEGWDFVNVVPWQKNGGIYEMTIISCREVQG